jgi:hypothetical protein
MLALIINALHITRVSNEGQLHCQLPCTFTLKLMSLVSQSDGVYLKANLKMSQSISTSTLDRLVTCTWNTNNAFDWYQWTSVIDNVKVIR